MFEYFSPGDIFDASNEQGHTTSYRFVGTEAAPKDSTYFIHLKNLEDASDVFVAPEWFNVRAIKVNGQLLKTFDIPMHWSQRGLIPIVSVSYADALKRACDITVPLPDGQYVSGSLALSCDEIKQHSKEPSATASLPADLPGFTCTCGCGEFYARQRLYVEVIVTGKNIFCRNAMHDNLSASVLETENPYGPFTCVRCGQAYEELE